MAGNETIYRRIQNPVYSAAALTGVNPLLFDGEVVYERDTGRHKIGDGVNTWNSLPYASGAEEIPGLAWKIQDGMLCVKPTANLKSPILKQCYVGILHYKNARYRTRVDFKTHVKVGRPINGGFKLVQDDFAQSELSWTDVRINPVKFDATKANAAGWVPIISVADLFARWIVRVPDPDFSGGGEIRTSQRNQYRRPIREARSAGPPDDAGVVLRRRCIIHRKREISNRGAAVVLPRRSKKLRPFLLDNSYLTIVTGDDK